MRVLAIVQNKGGVGKTTVARIIAEYFSKKGGLRVLGLDLDPQCNFSRRFLDMDIDPADKEGVVPPTHPDLANDEERNGQRYSSTADIFNHRLLEEGRAEFEAFPYETKLPGFDLLPGHASRLLRAERVHEKETELLVHDRLRLFLSMQDVQELYDLVLIDTPPSKGPLTVAAMRSATHIIIPTVPEPQPIEGLFGMIQLWVRENRRRRSHDQVKLIGILPNKVRNIVLHRNLLESITNEKEMGPFIIPHIMNELVGFAEPDAPGARPASVFDYKDDDKARLQAEQLCTYIEEKLFNG